MHVSEESDSGIVPMKPSNKDGNPSAEKAEGRPPVKENIHEPRRPSTQSGLGLSQGLMGVRRLCSAANHPRQEPYALTSARTDLRGGQRVIAVPTATERRYNEWAAQYCANLNNHATCCQALL
jgi:hypothetical protein